MVPGKELSNKDDELKPMHPKDSKPPPEFSGARKDFMVWHETFTSMLRLRSPKWGQVVEWLRSKREKRLSDGQAKADYIAYAAAHGAEDKYVEENFGLFQRHLYRYLLDYTKEKARLEVLANKEPGVFETYCAILHKGFNINDERRLDIEAKVLNPRKAKTEKDIPAALQEWRADQMWLAEAGYTHSHKLLKDENGRMAATILIKMMPSDGRNSVQRHLRESLAKFKDYDELEEELHAELYRREAETDKAGGINQLGALEGIEGEKDKDAEWTEEIWQDVWSPEYGWVQALENKRPREGDDEGAQEAKVRKGDGKANKGDKGSKGKGKDGKGSKSKGKGICWQCGAADHYQRDCPKGGKGKGPVFPAAWASWRPTPSWPTPTPSQWRAWIPRQEKGGKSK